MSKDDHGCKVISPCKHKERKPKKPHYIPRPWGKPYNYKCFQCPFTCMEKSHLYNHMKYSLCKNSLSLLIESDWPYKKGNIVPQDQLRPLQQAQGLRGAGKEEPRPGAGPEERPRPRRALEEEGEEGESQGGDEEEEEEGDGTEVAGMTREASSNERESSSDGGATRKGKRPESEVLMADVFSLEDQLLRARSVEVEAQLKHYKLSKTSLTAPGLLSEQWRLLTTSHTKAKPEVAQPRVASSIPCYPPPPSLADYPDPTGLNLSVLGVGYPLTPGLFSYINSGLPTSASSLTAQTHAQLAQLPFLASAAQLMHPASPAHPHADRTLLPPRFYYPFLCEHTFGGAASAQSEANKGLKTSTNGLEPSHPSFQPKVNLWKVPALRPSTTPASPAAWPPPQRESPDPSYRAGDKLPAAAKEGKAGWGLKRTGAPLGIHEAPVEKKPALGFTSEFLKNVQNNTSVAMGTDKLLLHSSSFHRAQPQSRQLDQWYSDPPASPNGGSSSPPRCSRPNSQDSTTGRGTGDAASQSAAALLSDLSKALQDYQEAERKISHLEREDTPPQDHLWEHLSKIRSELSHIHQALERTARQSEGPLDLSVKKDPATTEVAAAGDQSATRDVSLHGNATSETEEEEDEGEVEEEKKAEEEEREKKALESRKQSLDMLIKMSQAGLSVVKTEVLSPGGLSLRASPAEALWPGRTTKCEADSSVLLCPDGRPVVFTDAPSSAPKHSQRTPSIRLEPLCPLSPLTATDS